MPVPEGTAAAINALEADRKSDLATFLGTKAKNGGAWSGDGINAARRMLENLNNSPPGPFDTAEEQRQWREAWVRLSGLSAG
jgi:hypothetical protein